MGGGVMLVSYNIQEGIDSASIDYLKRKMEKLFGFAPSDADCIVHIRRVNDKIKTKIQMCSSVGIFKGESLAANALDSIVATMDLIQEKVMFWNTGRFKKHFYNEVSWRNL